LRASRRNHLTHCPAPRLQLAAAICLALTASGCAHVYVDAQGRTHAVGFVWLTLPTQRGSGGEAVRMRTVGVALTRSEVASSLVVGYQDATLAFLRNHSLVRSSELRMELGGTSEEENTDVKATR
jgi:hypothetical protein